MENREKIQLVLQFLEEGGYVETVKTLEQECGTQREETNVGGRLHRILDEWADLQLAMQPVAARGPDCLDLSEIERLEYSEKGDMSGHSKAIVSIAWGRDRADGLGMLASSGADMQLLVWSPLHPTPVSPVATHKLSAATLIALDFHPSIPGLLLAGGMDGKVHLMKDVDSQEGMRSLMQEALHSKYVVRVKFNATGTMFASASHDKTVSLFKLHEGKTIEEGGFMLLKQWAFTGAAESIAFTPDGKYLIVGSRDDNYLKYIQLDDFSVKKCNMNANGDDHVSFNPLDLKCSPSGSHLLVQTDKDRVIVMSTGTSIQIANLYGGTNGGLSQPRVAWHPSGKFVFGSSEDRRIYVWDIVSQKVIHRMQGHMQLVRDLVHHPSENLLFTCSYDRTIRMWTP